MERMDIAIAPCAAIRARFEHGNLFLERVFSELQVVWERGDPGLE